MGITSFLHDLEMNFLNELKRDDIPSEIDIGDWDVVTAWFREAFAQWFLENRDEVLSREWVRRGWADYILKPSTPGKLEEFYRVKPEFVDQMDAWLQDEIA